MADLSTVHTQAQISNCHRMQFSFESLQSELLPSAKENPTNNLFDGVECLKAILDLISCHVHVEERRRWVHELSDVRGGVERKERVVAVRHVHVLCGEHEGAHHSQR